MDDVGSLSWLCRTGGHLSASDRLSTALGAVPALVEGVRLGLNAFRAERRRLPLIEPPDTPMVRAARAHLAAHSCGPMVNHCYRTACWTLTVLQQNGGVTEQDVETTWAAALLHDVGLEHPVSPGDFSMGGVRALEAIARSIEWDEEQTRLASEAIALNLSTHVNVTRGGRIAWAMNVGGLAELGFPLHRLQWHPQRVAEVETLYPRTDFKATAMRLVREEGQRLPDGRFAMLGPLFPLIMRD